MTHEEDIWFQQVLNLSLHFVREGKGAVDAVGDACLAYNNIPEYFSERNWADWLHSCVMCKKWLENYRERSEA